MSDSLEENLRDTLSRHAAHLDHDAISRLSAIDYKPRRRRVRTVPTIGAVGLTGAGATVAAIVAFGSSAAPAFAGWEATPTAPASGQTVNACISGQSGTPVITDTRGPYTAQIYSSSGQDTECLSGNGVDFETTTSFSAAPTINAGQIELAGGESEDQAGDALTIVDGRIGAGVTAVSIERSDGSTVQATVSGGWYVAWWPGTTTAKTADVTTTTGTSTQAFPTETPASPNCTAGTTCHSGYAFGGGNGDYSPWTGSTTNAVNSGNTGS